MQGDCISAYEYRLYGNQDAGISVQGKQSPVEDLVDEMLAILSDRQQIIQKKEMEQAQASDERCLPEWALKEKRLWRCMHWETAS